MRAPRTTPILALPAYFDPLREADAWSRVTARAAAVRLAVLNPSSGPGPARQESYAVLADTLRVAGIRRIGYVDTDYGTRASADVRAECAAYRDWYDVGGIFMDQVSSDFSAFAAYEQYVGDARALGCRTVVLNPGVYPHRAYLNLADIVVTFEGDLQMHRRVRVPKWAMSIPPEQSCHLVYGVREHEIDDVRRRAARSNAGTLYITDGLLPNPWGSLAGYWEKLAELE